MDCISGLPLYELTTSANVSDSTVTEEILAASSGVLPIRDCIFLANKAYDVRNIYQLVKNVYKDETMIPLNKRNTKDPKKLPTGNPVCQAGLAMHNDGKKGQWAHTAEVLLPVPPV